MIDSLIQSIRERLIEAALEGYEGPPEDEGEAPVAKVLRSMVGPVATWRSWPQGGPELRNSLEDLGGLDLTPGLQVVRDLAEGIRMATEAGRKDTAAVLGVDLETPSAAALAEADARAAELVGMRITEDGRIIPNPNPRYAITETIRADVASKVSQALEAGWSPQKLTAELAGIFDYSRAETIARTETGFAYNRGAGAIYEEAGQEFVQVLDGRGCTPDGHNDQASAPSGKVGVVEVDRLANGQIWPVSEVTNRPLGHPRCVRGFIPYEGETNP